MYFELPRPSSLSKCNKKFLLAPHTWLFVKQRDKNQKQTTIAPTDQYISYDILLEFATVVSILLLGYKWILYQQIFITPTACYSFGYFNLKWIGIAENNSQFMWNIDNINFLLYLIPVNAWK